MATAVTTTIDDEVLAKLDALSGGRSRDAVIAEAVRSYVDEAATLAALAAPGLASVREGRGLSHDAFVSALRTWRRENGLGTAASD